MSLPDPPEPGPEGAEDASPAQPEPRLGTSTFTIEGRSAPALFVVGWLATLIGFVTTAVALMSGAATAGPILLILGVAILSIGLIAAAGSQGIERRVHGVLPYVGPSPLIVFVAVLPVSIVAGVVVALPFDALGVPLDGPFGALLSVSVQALVYVALIRLLVVDPGALSWLQMGVRRFDRTALAEIAYGAAWAIPVLAVASVVGAVLQQFFQVSAPNPLPPTGDSLGFAISLLAGAIVAPFGEELLFRAFATTAWVKGMGVRAGVVRGAFLFAFAHILTVAGSDSGQALIIGLVAFVARIPIGLALGWIFVRRGTIWASFGLHATYNAIILVIVEAASRAAS